jgi:hypothetical protein
MGYGMYLLFMFIGMAFYKSGILTGDAPPKFIGAFVLLD